MKYYLKILLILILSSCVDNTNYTGVHQTYVGNILYTNAVFKGEDVYTARDCIDLQTSDSIKLIRYKEAEKWIEKFIKIDKLK